MHNNIPQSQPIDSESGWPVTPAPLANSTPAPCPDAPMGDLNIPVPLGESLQEIPAAPADVRPAFGVAQRPIDIRDRILAVVEVLFACGVFSNTAAYAFVLAIFQADPESLMKNPEFLFYFLMVDTVVLLLTIHFFLQLRNHSFFDLGLRPRALAFNVLIGLLMVPGLFILTGVVSFIFQSFFPEYYMTKNPMLETIKTSEGLAFFIASGILAGGVREEIQRAFILTRFKKYLFGVLPGLLLWSFFFGYMHYSTQGLQGAVITGLLGLCFGILFLRRRSLYGPIAAHAAFNTIQLIWFWIASRA